MKSLISLAYLHFMFLLPNPFKWFTDKFSNAGDTVTDAVADAAADSVSKSLTGFLDPILSCGKKFVVVILALIIILILCKVLGSIHKTSSDALHTRKMNKMQEKAVQNAQNAATMNTIKKINSNNDRMDSF